MGYKGIREKLAVVNFLLNSENIVDILSLGVTRIDKESENNKGYMG